MKKDLLALIILCLFSVGCTSNVPEKSENIAYSFEDMAEENELYKHYNDVLLKANITKNSDITIPELTDENKDRYSKTLKRIMEIDVDKSLAEMDDITNEIYAETDGQKRVYRDKDHPNAMILSHGGELTLLYELRETAKEYRPFIDDICAKTGLTYCGMTLGRKFDDLDQAQTKDEYEFTGQNMIAFSNTEFAVNTASQEFYTGESYRSLPLRVNFYMNKDQIKYVNIFFLTNEKTNSLTAENLKQLSFSPIAAKLIGALYTAKKDVSGEEDGIKYTLHTNACSGWNDMQYSVLSLEY